MHNQAVTLRCVVHHAHSILRPAVDTAGGGGGGGGGGGVGGFSPWGCGGAARELTICPTVWDEPAGELELVLGDLGEAAGELGLVLGDVGEAAGELGLVLGDGGGAPEELGLGCGEDTEVACDCKEGPAKPNIIASVPDLISIWYQTLQAKTGMCDHLQEGWNLQERIQCAIHMTQVQTQSLLVKLRPLLILWMAITGPTPYVLSVIGSLSKQHRKQGMSQTAPCTDCAKQA